MRVRICSVVGCICLSAPFVPAAIARAPLPSSAGLVLGPTDAGIGFFERAPETGAEAAAEAPLGGPLGLLEKLAHWGRAGGDQADLVRRATPAALQEGPLEILSSASVYRTAAGARAALAYALRSLVPKTYAPIGPGFAQGQEAHLYVRADASGLGTMLAYIGIWRERNVNASLVVVGRVGVVSAADLPPLERKQEARIRAQLNAAPRR